jgi:hypothetical protein
VDALKVSLNPRYVVDEHGERREVLLDIAEFEALVERYRALEETLEDQLDARALEAAIAENQTFRSFDEVLAEMKRDGLL